MMSRRRPPHRTEERGRRGPPPPPVVRMEALSGIPCTTATYRMASFFPAAERKRKRKKRKAFFNMFQVTMKCHRLLKVFSANCSSRKIVPWKSMPNPFAPFFISSVPWPVSGGDERVRPPSVAPLWIDPGRFSRGRRRGRESGADRCQKVLKGVGRGQILVFSTFFF